jgi:hypothetical protein
MAEIQSSCRKRRAVKPLAIIGRGFGATAKGIWRLARGGVRAGATLRKGPPAPPLASLTAVHAGRNYMFQDDEKWWAMQLHLLNTPCSATDPSAA